MGLGPGGGGVNQGGAQNVNTDVIFDGRCALLIKVRVLLTATDSGTEEHQEEVWMYRVSSVT